MLRTPRCNRAIDMGQHCVGKPSGHTLPISAYVQIVEAFEQAFRLLEGTTKDLKDGDFFFSPTIKMPTGAARKKQAQEGLKSATEAYNKFVTITNKGLMMELNKLPLAGEPQVTSK